MKKVWLKATVTRVYEATPENYDEGNGIPSPQRMAEIDQDGDWMLIMDMPESVFIVEPCEPPTTDKEG